MNWEEMTNWLWCDIYDGTGLDPAYPDYSMRNTKDRLDRSDAEFVDVIHTNSGSLFTAALSFPQAIGHADFFVNGGHSQPGCGFITSGDISDLIRKCFNPCQRSIFPFESYVFVYLHLPPPQPTVIYAAKNQLSSNDSTKIWFAEKSMPKRKSLTFSLFCYNFLLKSCHFRARLSCWNKTDKELLFSSTLDWWRQQHLA